MITFPVRRVATNDIHVELRHQQDLNRAERLVARAGGLEGPSDAQLRANLERRASLISSAEKRFNIPPQGFGLAAEASNEFLVVENDITPSNSSQLASQSSEIDPDGADTSFVFTVPIGTPARDFRIILDSGSSDFWVESTNCTSQSGGGCGNHTFLGADTSSTFVNTKKPWSVVYGSGAASGELVNDTIIMGGMVLPGHTFGVAHSISQSFSGDSIADGLMGFGKRAVQPGRTHPDTVPSAGGFISAPIISYRLPRSIDHINNGEITFGGLDASKFDSSTLVTLNATNSNFWETQLGGVTVNGATVGLSGPRIALMDTGTTLLVVPATDVDPIHAKIPGAIKKGTGSWTVPCNTTASVALQFGGKSFPISPKDLPFASAAGRRATARPVLARLPLELLRLNGWWAILSSNRCISLPTKTRTRSHLRRRYDAGTEILFMIHDSLRATYTNEFCITRDYRTIIVLLAIYF
ncbi:aspartic peptidase domain-containing protein [Mycena galopus ATCC 62051]|nr:aspartic peptidase domain-containing protein [Mycena galopus ATCC 62051]